MNKPKDEPGLQTILSHCGRNLEASGGYVNVPPYEGSTILHDDMEDLFGRVPFVRRRYCTDLRDGRRPDA